MAKWPSDQVGTLDHWTTETTRPLFSELFINTSGVGSFEHNLRFGPENIRAGDKVLINGTIGDHEASIALARGQFDFTRT